MEAKNISIKRKICKIGTGHAVFLPKKWVDQIEQEHGPVSRVAIEIGDDLTIKPIFKETTK